MQIWNYFIVKVNIVVLSPMSFNSVWTSIYYALVCAFTTTLTFFYSKQYCYWQYSVITVPSYYFIYFFIIVASLNLHSHIRFAYELATDKCLFFLLVLFVWFMIKCIIFERFVTQCQDHRRSAKKRWDKMTNIEFWDHYKYWLLNVWFDTLNSSI